MQRKGRKTCNSLVGPQHNPRIILGQVHQYRQRYRIIALQPCMRHPKLGPSVKTDKEPSLVNPGKGLVIMPKNKRRDLHQICINV